MRHAYCRYYFFFNLLLESMGANIYIKKCILFLCIYCIICRNLPFKGFFRYVGADFILRYVLRNFFPRCRMWWYRYFVGLSDFSEILFKLFWPIKNWHCLMTFQTLSSWAILLKSAVNMCYASPNIWLNLIRGHIQVNFCIHGWFLSVI